MIVTQAVDMLVHSGAGERFDWPRYTGPRCGAPDCGAYLQPGPDGFMTGCEHAGASRNLTLDEQFALRRAPKVGAVVEAHPEPVVLWRDAEPGEIPRAVELVLRKVVPPWSVRTTYSRGTNLNRPYIVDSVVIRFHHPDGRRGWAGWVDGKFDASFVWDGVGWVDQVNATNLKALLADPSPEAST